MRRKIPAHAIACCAALAAAGLVPIHTVDRAFIPAEKAKGQFRLDRKGMRRARRWIRRTLMAVNGKIRAATILLAACAVTGVCANGHAPVAEIVMFESPKSAVTNVVDMTPSAGGGWQCRIARETVDAFRLDHIEVTSPLVRARKGEAGYFVLGDGRYGTFRLDTGICGERPKAGFLPVAGMKTPRGVYRITVRGLALESDLSVVATNGV